MLVEPIYDLSEEMTAKFMRKCTFSVNGDIIKEGFLKLFVQRGVTMEFHLTNKNSVKVYEVPYPFKLERTPDGYNFDYRLKSMFLPIRTVDIEDMQEDDSKPAPFYDKILNIKFS